MSVQLASQIASLLDDVATTEARIAVTVAILLVTVVCGWLLVPRAVRLSQRYTARWLEQNLEGRAERSRETLAGALPISFGLRLFVGFLQLALFAVAGVTVLTLWGRYDLVLTAFPVANRALEIAGQVVVTAMLLAGAYVASDVLEEFVDDFAADTDRITTHQQQLITRIAQVSVLTIVGITVLGLWGVNLGGLLVGAGFLGIVLGMASRQTLAALIAGFVLMFSRPFEIGDWVEIGDEEGFVTEITIMNTHMRNFDGEFVVIPNDRVTDDPVTNRSREGRLRLRMQVGIAYDDDVEHATEVARGVLDDVDRIANNPQPVVIPTGFADSSITLDLRYWIDPPTPQARWRTKAAVVEGVQRRFAEEGITIPYPQRTLSGAVDSPPDTPPKDLLE